MRISGAVTLALVAGLVAGGCGDKATTDGDEVVDSDGSGEIESDGSAEIESGDRDTGSKRGGGVADPTSHLEKITVTPENATIEWIGTKDEGKHDGGFRKLSGRCVVDQTDLSTAKISLEIDTTSIWSDAEKLTNHLKSADFFEVNEFPTATFQSTGVKLTPDGTYSVTGDLTLHGVTKEITFPATMAFADGTLTVKAEFTINRFDYGIDYGKGKVHDDVTIKASLAGKNS